MRFVHYDQTVAAALWALIDIARSTRDRGEALEMFIAYLFQTHGQFAVRSDVRPIDAQFDLLVRKLSDRDPFLRELGLYMIVEAKNWQEPVDAAAIRSFIGSLRSAGCHAGILVSMQGVTGGRGNRAALFAIRKFYHKDNVVVIVLDRQDLQYLITFVPPPLLELLLQKYERIRFDRP